MVVNILVRKRKPNLDYQKEEICRFYGLKLIRIANSLLKDYEAIISLFEFGTQDLTNLDQAYQETNLFIEEEND